MKPGSVKLTAATLVLVGSSAIVSTVGLKNTFDLVKNAFDNATAHEVTDKNTVTHGPFEITRGPAPK